MFDQTQSSALTNSLGATGAVSVCLSDSWSGRSLIESFGKVSPLSLSSLAEV